MNETVEREFAIDNELGLHLRPAGRFVALASRFTSEIAVGREDEWVDGRSLLSLVSLAAGSGSALRFRATGPDAAEAVEALGKLLGDGEHKALR